MQAQARNEFTAIAAAANDEGAIAKASSALERMAPHLLPMITSSWGTWRLHRYLSRVTMMDRPGREGFAPEVAQELFSLFLLNKELAGVPDYQDISR